MARDGKPDSLSELITRAQAEVAYCATCQPYDSGECVWIFGVRTSMYETLMELDVPEEHLEAVAEALSCPNCSAPLDISCDVGLKTEYEKQIDALHEKWYEEYDFRVEDFYEHLERYPYLGLEHELGRRIQKTIARMPKITIDGEDWYRARRVKSSHVLRTQDMYPPEPCSARIREGRFSHTGQRVFYLANSEKAAAKEVLQTGEGIVWVQCFRLSNVSQILDLVGEPFTEPSPRLGVIAYGLIHTDALRREVNRSSSWKPEYFVPRFIADCARISGFRGIRFISTRNYSINIVLFDWSDDMLPPAGEPALFCSHGDDN